MEYVPGILALISLWLTLETLSPHSKADPRVKPWQAMIAWTLTWLAWNWLST